MASTAQPAWRAAAHRVAAPNGSTLLFFHLLITSSYGTMPLFLLEPAAAGALTTAQRLTEDVHLIEILPGTDVVLQQVSAELDAHINHLGGQGGSSRRRRCHRDRSPQLASGPEMLCL